MNGRLASGLVSAAALLAAGALVGCAATVPRGALPVGGALGTASEAVFVRPELAGAIASAEGAEFGRRDAALSVREAQPLLATAQWPEEERASLERRRYITVSTSASTFLFFLPPTRDVRRDFYRGGYR